ncbi:MAG: hypothetical protein FJ368_04000 [Pelagibacterales bacterium]|nr:hypothetical protein [Pelagibacterales bacterium]
MFSNFEKTKEDKLARFHNIFKKQVNDTVPKNVLGGFTKKAIASIFGFSGILLGGIFVASKIVMPINSGIRRGYLWYRAYF